MNRKSAQAMGRYALAFVRWVLTGLLIGAVCGAVGGAFAILVEEATHLRQHTPWLLYLLPAGGLVIALLYRVMKLPLSLGTDEIIATVRTQGKVPFLMAPAIFLSTVVTHLLGGSAGREGAALQLGGSLGVRVGMLTHPWSHSVHSADAGAADVNPSLSDSYRMYELCGMAALFSALFGTPLTATIFVIEVIDVGKINDRAILPCIISSVTASLVARAVGTPVEPFGLQSGLVTVNAVSALQALAVGVVCALVAILFCRVMHKAGPLLRKLVPNDFLRIALGGGAVILLTLLVGSQDYNGGGMHVIFAALAGQAQPTAFLWKILFTAVSLGSGFKGGEIVPSFFIGSTLGCTAAALLGLNPAVGAALGLVGVFCGVTNAPLASMMLAVELFGTEYLPLLGISVAVSFMLSGHVSLYHTQGFAQRKMGHRD